MSTTTANRSSRRLPRRDVILVGSSALVSLLLSPFTAIWAVVLGAPVALFGGALSRGGRRSGARTALLIAVGIMLGAIPYIAAGLLMTDGAGSGGGSSG